MRRCAILLFACAAGVFPGCKKESIQVYEAPKDAPSAAPAASEAPDSPGAPGKPAGRPPWTTPEGWVEKPSSGGMRIASYGVTSADGRSVDISVVALGPEAGSELDNVNRWRGQLELGAVGAQELAAMVRPAPIGRLQGRLVEMVSEKPTLDGKYKARLLAATLALPNTTVFFKLQGEDALAAENRAKFLAWIQSVDTGDAAGAPEAPEGASATPAPAPAMSGPVAAPPPSTTPQWDPPAGWKPKAGSAMRLASFEVAGEGGETGDLSVVALGSAAGDVLANVNRWRGQLGLAPVDAAGLASAAPPLAVEGGGSAVLVDIAGAGEHAGSSMLAAMVARPDRTWFYKLSGPSALVAREKSRFTQFVAKVKYP